MPALRAPEPMPSNCRAGSAPATRQWRRQHGCRSCGTRDHHRVVRPGVNGARKVTNAEITSWVDVQLALPSNALDITKAVDIASKWHQVNHLMSLSVSSFLMLLLGSIDDTAAVDFFNALDGLNFQGEDDPIKQLYQRLNTAKETKEGLRISQVLWFVLTAWNAYRDGQNGGSGLLDHPFVKTTAAGRYVPQNPKARRTKKGTIYPTVPDPV